MTLTGICIGWMCFSSGAALGMVWEMRQGPFRSTWAEALHLDLKWWKTAITWLLFPLWPLIMLAQLAGWRR